MKIKLVSMILIALIAFGTAGCGAKANVENLPAPATAGGELIILSSTAFTDDWGWYHVVGEIQNNTGIPYTSIEIAVEVRDADGNTLLKDSSGSPKERVNFTPLLETIAPKTTAPFEYSFDPEGAVPATYTITIWTFMTGMTDYPAIAYENIGWVNDSSGSFYLSGDLVNPGSEWVQVNGLAGAGLDPNSQVVTAGWSATHASVLAPAGDANGLDRTPFIIQFAVPRTAEVTQWALFWDVTTSEAPVDYGLQVEITNNYFDEVDNFHIIGRVTNGSTEKVRAQLIGGVYGADGVALDATWSVVPLIIDPGATVPFDLSSFNNVNWNLKLSSQIQGFTVRVDPSFTYVPTWEVVPLNSNNDVVTIEGGSWTINGNVLNTSGKELSGETVVVSIYDPQGKLVTTTSTRISPEGEAITDGQNSNYEVVLYFAPNVDVSGYTYRTIVQGEVK